MPRDAAPIFAFRDDEDVVLRVDPEGLGLNCHFFVQEEIEFDLDPRDIPTSDTFQRLLAFMRGLSDLLQKEIRLTPENGDHHPYFRYSPQRQAWEWCM